MLTDNEIIKALAIHLSDDIDCDKCPYYNNDPTCSLELMKNTIDLINRQKAEIERLKEEKQQLTEKFNCQQTVYADLSEIIKKQAAELKEYQKHIDNDIIYVKNIKAEAVKEFSEKTNKMFTEIYNKHIFGNNDLEAEEKDAIINFSDDVTYGFNNLVKEMVGAENG